MGKRILKKEKGSITIFVLSTMLVVLGVIFVAYFSMMNKLSSQEDEIRKIYEEYNVSDDEMKQIYDETLEELNTLPKADGNQENNIVVNDSLGNKIEVPKGFYLGRYEARDEVTESTRNNSTNDNNQVVTKADKFVYNYVTQNQAATLSRNMYGETENFTSDLVNSYAWDTALVFFQKCSDDSN